MSQHDGLWSAGLAQRTPAPSHEPECIGCREEPIENRTPSELTLLWRRSKGFRRHRTYR
jgi:hypothetical protein